MHEHHVDENKLRTIVVEEDEVVEDMALLFKMFADPTRLRILHVLKNCDMNVCEIAAALEMTHSAISHQLATLKMANLVKSKKNGKEVFYSLADDHVNKILDMGREHVLEV